MSRGRGRDGWMFCEVPVGHRGRNIHHHREILQESPAATGAYDEGHHRMYHHHCRKWVASALSWICGM